MTENEYATWSLTEEGKQFLAAYITSEDVNIMEVGVETSGGAKIVFSSTTPLSLTHNVGNSDIETEEADMRKSKRTRETEAQINPIQTLILSQNPNPCITHEKPIFQSSCNGDDEMIDYSDIPAENRMEYHLNSMIDNRSMEFDSAKSEHNGSDSRNHFGNSATSNQITQVASLDASSRQGQ
ncbi:uncharacterized protein LOC113272355 [Papaver somniferum]|uniref:uncharacterized protein LOC113272355 n=1 Tax=Papaver somniferum TaxID=3469 RepID=UPI000E704B48|nr:uncharacterized protein LOC113272355 [Papaver somniferum]